MDYLIPMADTLNREYQGGGDAATLARVAHTIAALLPAPDRAHFLDVASMGGLPLELPLTPHDLSLALTDLADVAAAHPEQPLTAEDIDDELREAGYAEHHITQVAAAYLA